MKKLKITFGLGIIMNISVAQSPWIPVTNYLDKNNIKATISSDGQLFDGNKFEVPKGSGKSTIKSASLWLGGIDANGQLKLSAQEYSSSVPDFFAGLDQNLYSQNNYNKVWKINKTSIDSFRLGLYSQIPLSITNWPGEVCDINGSCRSLAPFKDMDGDGTYNPANGDYPVIKGDQALFFCYNDHNFNHGTGGGTAYLEICGMAYEYQSIQASINNTVFINYKIINRSNYALGQTFLGNWVDFDLGNNSDDYIGTDVQRNAIYAYNGDSIDSGASGYGSNPPVQSLVFLEGPMADPNDALDNDHNGFMDELNEHINLSNSIYYNDDLSLTGEPTNATQYYNYLKGFWKDTTKLEYGGNGWQGSATTNGIQCNYVYPNDSDPNGFGTYGVPVSNWSEVIAGNTPGDRRILGVSGRFTFVPGDTKTLDVAYITTWGNGSVQSSLDQAKIDIDSVQSFFNARHLNELDSTLGNAEIKSKRNNLTLFPNPTNSILNIQLQGLKIRSIDVFDITGKKIRSISINEINVVEINVADLSSGLYLIKANDGKMVYTGKFVKD